MPLYLLTLIPVISYAIVDVLLMTYESRVTHRVLVENGITLVGGRETVFDNDKLPHDHQHVRDDVADEQTRVELDAVLAT